MGLTGDHAAGGANAGVLTLLARQRCVMLALAVLIGSGCAAPPRVVDSPPRPDVSPPRTALDGEAALTLDGSDIRPMYTELVAVDLPGVVAAAAADNLDIQRARQAVEASRGRYESTVGSVFPALVPTALFEHVEGTVRATEGVLVGVGFNTFQPSLAIQWVINPGRVFYDLIAARKRLSASGYRQRAVVLETIRRSVVEYYSLVLAQARVAAATQGAAEAEELLRINRLRTRAGTGVRADELRAEARLAQRRQDLVLAMQRFYNASVALAVTLHLDASVTLVPSAEELPPVSLVREDIDIEEMLGFALVFRPDLLRVRALVEAIAADRGASWWGAFGPQFAAGYQYGGITGQSSNTQPAQGIPGNLIVNPASPDGRFSGNPLADGLIREGILRSSRRLDGRGDESFGFSDQQRATASAGWRLSVAAFGDLRTAGAVERQARIDAEARLDRVRAEVVTAARASRANHDLIGLARQQVVAAAEALRLSEANLKAGTMTTLDVLQAQDAATQARLRHAEAVVRYNQSQVNLLAAMGLLEESSLTGSSEDGASVEDEG